MTLLLPLSFSFTGLRTSIRLLDSVAPVRDTLIVLAAAVLGKGGLLAIVARAQGLNWR